MVSACCSKEVFAVETEYHNYYACHGCGRPCKQKERENGDIEMGDNCQERLRQHPTIEGSRGMACMSS